MKAWKAEIKEKENQRILRPEFWFSDENVVTEHDMIEFWCLDNDDIEWYKLELINI